MNVGDRRGPGAAVGRACFRTRRSPPAEVAGSIVDQTSAPLPGVRVTIRGVAVRTADTGAAGDFAFPDLPEGDYEISAELSGFERQRRARARAGGRTGHACPSPCESPSWKRPSSRPQRRAGAMFKQIPIAISAVSQADLGRLGTSDHRRGAGAGPLGDVFAEHRLGPAHDPRDRHKRCVCRIGSEFGDLSRRRLPRSAGDGVRAVSRSGAHRSASRTAGHAVRTQRRRRGDEPHIPPAHQ